MHSDTEIRIQTIEKTGKRWKLLQLVSMLAIIGGFTMSCAMTTAVNADGTTTSVDEATISVGVLIAFFGLCSYIIARIGAWWFHG